MLKSPAPTHAGYGKVPLNLTGTGLSVVQDGTRDGRSEDGILFSSYEARRVHGTRSQRIASITVYEDGNLLVLHGIGGGATPADYTARDRLRKHLHDNYSVMPVTIPEFRA